MILYIAYWYTDRDLKHILTFFVCKQLYVMEEQILLGRVIRYKWWWQDLNLLHCNTQKENVWARIIVWIVTNTFSTMDLDAHVRIFWDEMMLVDILTSEMYIFVQIVHFEKSLLVMNNGFLEKKKIKKSVYLNIWIFSKIVPISFKLFLNGLSMKMAYNVDSLIQTLRCF